MLDTEVKQFVQHVISSIKEYISLAIGFILLVLKWQHDRINNMEKKYVSKEVFEEFRKGLFNRIDKLEENLKEDIKEIKNKLNK